MRSTYSKDENKVIKYLLKNIYIQDCHIRFDWELKFVCENCVKGNLSWVNK